jgi:hypothetical protein
LLEQREGQLRGVDRKVQRRENRSKQNMRVLVIEDEPQLARHVGRALTRHRHDATVRHDAPEVCKQRCANQRI